MKAKKNISNLAIELTDIVGQSITEEHIHSSSNGREYYIQAPKQGAPMVLHHYRGAFFVDMHPADFEALVSDKISAHEYICSANWQVGYYWGGGSMVGGGYYQPLDVINRKEEVRRYLQILSCRGYKRACGYMPTEKDCNECNLEDCPFSKYKSGSWDSEMDEPDPRIDLFKSLRKKFEQEYPEYSLCGFSCDEIPEGEIWLRPNGRYIAEETLSFKVYASESLIRALLMHEVVPEDWDEYASSLKFRVREMYKPEVYEVTKTTLAKVYEGKDYTKKVEKVPLMARVMNLFKKF